MESGMFDRSKMNEARKARLEAENAATDQKPKENVLDRSKMNEARKNRIEEEIANATDKPKEDVLNRDLINQQREARIIGLKGSIEKRLSAVEDKVGVDEKGPISKEGILDRNFGK